jgi:hypothetical protein
MIGYEDLETTLVTIPEGTKGSVEAIDANKPECETQRIGRLPTDRLELIEGNGFRSHGRMTVISREVTKNSVERQDM